MSDGEFRILQRIEGDASGAIKANQDAAAANLQYVGTLEQVTAAENAAAEASARRATQHVGKNVPIDMGGGRFEADQAAEQSAKKVTAALDEELQTYAELRKAREEIEALNSLGAESGNQTGGFQNEAEKVKELGSSFDASSVKAGAFSAVLSQIDPELSRMYMTGWKLSRMFKEGFGPAAINTGAFLGALAAVAASISTISQAIASAIEQAKEAIAQVDRANEKQRAARVGVGEQLALHGVGDRASLNAATGFSKSLQDKGVEQQAADITAAAVTTAIGGGMNIPRDQMADLAALQQQGAISLTRGINITDTVKNVQQAIDLLNKLPSVDKVALLAGAEQRARPRQEFVTDIRRGDLEATKQYLIDRQNMSPEEAALRAEDLQNMIAGKPANHRISDSFIGIPGLPHPAIPGTPRYDAIESVQQRMYRQFEEDSRIADEIMATAAERATAVEPDDKKKMRPRASAKPVADWGGAFEPVKETTERPLFSSAPTPDEQNRPQRVDDIQRANQPVTHIDNSVHYHGGINYHGQRNPAFSRRTNFVGPR